MKKSISLFLAMLLCFSLCTPSFAAENSTADGYGYYAGEIADMTLDELYKASVVDATLAGQLNTATDEYYRLCSYISCDSIIQECSVNDINTLLMIIETNSLSAKQADTLVSSWSNQKTSASTSTPDPETARILQGTLETRNTNIQSRTYSGNIVTHVNSSDITGVHYMVKSTAGGYYKASGTFTLPHLTINSSDEDPDVIYGMFGIYTSSNLGFDLGAFYKQTNDEWRFFISGYVPSADGGYAHYWKEIDGISYPKNQDAKVHLVASVTKYSTYDVLTLSVTDATTWNYLDDVVVETYETGWDSTFTYNKAGATQSYVTSGYGNVYFNREVTLAHKHHSMRSFTGTVVSGAKWSNVYLYTTSGYSLWQAAQTQYARKIGQTEVYANKISVSITNKWYEDTTTINYSN